MLTLGAEYEDTWCAATPGNARRPEQRAKGEPRTVAETDTGAGDTEEPSWRAVDTHASRTYDAVYRLHARRDGVRPMVHKHETLNRAMWPRR